MTSILPPHAMHAFRGHGPRQSLSTDALRNETVTRPDASSAREPKTRPAPDMPVAMRSAVAIMEHRRHQESFPAGTSVPSKNGGRPARPNHRWLRLPQRIIPTQHTGRKHVAVGAGDGQYSSNHRGCASTPRAPRCKCDRSAAPPLAPHPAPCARLEPSSRARTHRPNDPF